MVSMHVQMLTQPSQCYLVLLIATAGLTFRAKEAVPSSSGEPYKLDPPPLPHDTPATSPSQELATLVIIAHCDAPVDLGLMHTSTCILHTTEWTESFLPSVHSQHAVACDVLHGNLVQNSSGPPKPRCWRAVLI